MNEPTLNDADVRRMAQDVLHRERRRIRALAIVTVGLWVLAALLIPSVYLPLGAKVKHFAQVLDADGRGGDGPIAGDAGAPPSVAAKDIPQVLANVRHQQSVVGQFVYHQWIIGAIILAFALGAAVLASASTVALALTIRRVTLRQVGASLAEISEQLRQLRQDRTGG